ncbi:MAG: DUF2279 domain-containing protein [Flavobacteriales bacterium]|nr:DUF2279 domain-containing protein [Flavobacteriales bacterium]
MVKFITFLSFVLIINQSNFGQTISDSCAVDKSRLTWVIGTEAALYSGTIIGLNELWYKDFPRSSFHHFNDNSDWLQMDKVGHVVTAYYVGMVGMDALRWAGVDQRKSRWYGGGLGWLFLSSVEVLDGFSEEWGFSSGDMIANTLGTGLLIGQDIMWNEQRIVLKFSFKQSSYASLRPGTLGMGWEEEVIKDYNGQTYWVSANIHSFLPEESGFPKWLSISGGYGVDGVIASGSDYVILSDQASILIPQQRQFYLGPDIDLWRIPTKRKGLKTLFKALGFIKLPLPALKLQDGELEFQGFTF